MAEGPEYSLLNSYKEQVNNLLSVSLDNKDRNGNLKHLIDAIGTFHGRSYKQQRANDIGFQNTVHSLLKDTDQAKLIQIDEFCKFEERTLEHFINELKREKEKGAEVEPANSKRIAEDLSFIEIDNILSSLDLLKDQIVLIQTCVEKELNVRALTTKVAEVRNRRKNPNIIRTSPLMDILEEKPAVREILSFFRLLSVRHGDLKFREDTLEKDEYLNINQNLNHIIIYLNKEYVTNLRQKKAWESYITDLKNKGQDVPPECYDQLLHYKTLVANYLDYINQAHSLQIKNESYKKPDSLLEEGIGAFSPPSKSVEPAIEAKVPKKSAMKKGKGSGNKSVKFKENSRLRVAADYENVDRNIETNFSERTGDQKSFPFRRDRASDKNVMETYYAKDPNIQFFSQFIRGKYHTILDQTPGISKHWKTLERYVNKTLALFEATLEEIQKEMESNTFEPTSLDELNQKILKVYGDKIDRAVETDNGLMFSILPIYQTEAKLALEQMMTHEPFTRWMHERIGQDLSQEI